MKKVFVFALAAVVAASCNSGENTTEQKADSLTNIVDSTADARKDSIDQAADSTSQRIENTIEKTDSANKAIADSATKAK
ncbi:MAG: hypothetical protein EOO16_07065 [Chitinophagaceae bacterium]|nr:MAG: hypothetical protein EOO16_07065 [Chitinophagaceae bacterium]